MLKRTVRKLNIKGLNYRLLLGIALIIYFAFSILITKVFGDENKDYSRVYALRVETGTNSKIKDIGTFVITYVDKSGTQRRAYISPYDGDYNNSIQLALNNDTGDVSGIKKKIKNYKDVLGHDVAWYSGLGNSRPLEPNSINTYFFKSYYDVADIISIGVVSGDNGMNGKCNWDCYGMELYKVENVKGVVPYGYMSNTFELGFEGKTLYEMKYKNKTSSVAAIFEFGGKEVKYIYNPEYYKKTGKSVPNNSIGATTTEAWLEKSNSSFTNLNFNKDLYTIKLDIADIYGAGIECYVAKDKVKLSEVKPAEALVLNLTYKTLNGSLRTVNMPVITSALSYAMDKGVINGSSELADILPQGNSIAFGCQLPEFASLFKANLYYVSASDSSTRNLTALTGLNASAPVHTKYYEAMASDSISFTGVSIYQGGSAINVEYNSAALSYTVNGNAQMLYQMISSDRRGETIDPGTSKDLDFHFVGDKKPASISDKRELYLFEAKTANILSSGTTADITATIKYIDNEDKEREYQFLFSDMAKEFFGYWPDENGDEAGYQMLTKNGATYYAILPIENVKKMIGMSIGTMGKDDWMTDNITIYKINDNSKIGPITYKWNEGNGNSKVIHSRSINGHVIDIDTKINEIIDEVGKTYASVIASIGNGDGEENDPDKSAGIYVGDNKKREIGFSGKEVSRQEDSRTNYFKYMYDMPFNVAYSNFGFDTKQVAYTVTVNVDSDPYGLIEQGNIFDDCGSTNYFYFQLVFENGTSAYVQANQQMYSDSFRSGVSESFKIYVNQEYGKLTAINVIPEVDPKNGNPYDKLMIKNIEVSRVTENGLTQAFTTDTIGWIGIDYTDAAVQNKFHKANELTKVYPFVKESNKANLLLAISYDSIPEGYGQFQGTVKASISYKKTDGTSETEDVDVVTSLREFNGTNGLAEVSDRSIMIGEEQHMLIKSDKNLMFRPNHTDRFIWTAKDIKYVEDISFEAFNYSGEKVKLKINTVSIAVVQNADIEGHRAINSSGEYIIVDAGVDYDNIMLSKEGNYVFDLDSNTKGNVRIGFDIDEDTCITSPDTSKFPYIVTKVPAAKNDTLNIYAYVANNDDISRMEVKGVVIYEDGGITRETPDYFKLTTIVDENGKSRRAYACENLVVGNLGTLKSITMVAHGPDADVAIDYIIVQHIRNNVVISSKKVKFDFSNTSIKDLEQTATNIEDFNSFSGYQEITLQLGDNMEATTITKEEHDIAVALDYLFGNTGKEYHSENVFFSSDNKATSIGSGDTLKIRINNGNVGKINGLSVSATKFLDIDLKSATVGVYTPKKNPTTGETEYVCTDWYSFDCNTKISNETKGFKATSDKFDAASTWSPVTMNIKTLSSYVTENGSFGADLGLTKGQKLELVVTYEENGDYKELVISNIADKLRSGELSAGMTAEYVFLAKNLSASNIKKIAFRPYDDNDEGTVIWGLDSVAISFGDGMKSSSSLYVEPRKVLYENEGLSEISFAKVVMSANVSQVDATFKNGDDTTVLSSKEIESLGLVKQASNNVIELYDLSADNIYKLELDVQNSDMGYEATPGKGIKLYNSEEENVLYFSVDGNAGERKSIKIASKENAESFLTVSFEIESKEVIEEIPPVEESNPSTEGDDTETEA